MPSILLPSVTVVLLLLTHLPATIFHCTVFFSAKEIFQLKSSEPNVPPVVLDTIPGLIYQNVYRKWFRWHSCEVTRELVKKPALIMT